MNKIKKISKSIISGGIKTSLYILIAVLVGVSAVYATSKLTPPGSVTNTMYSLTDIYNLASGTTATEGTGAIETTPGTITETGKTLTEVYSAISTEVAKLSSSVIASGTSAFGITGNTNVVNTSSGDATVTDILTGKKAWVDGSEVTGTATAGTNYGIPKTGQTTCYDEGGALMADCTGTYQDGDSPHGLPSTGDRFTLDAVNNIVTDNATGLEWDKCSLGLSGTLCDTGTATSQTWTTALSTCNSKATDGGGWRLPNINELFSTTSKEVQGPPAINHTFFPATQSGNYWSSTSYQLSLDGAWSVSYSNGGTGLGVKTSGYYVRCVR